MNRKTENKKIKISENKGFALLTAIIITSMLLLVSFVVADLAYKELILTSTGQQSQIAFYMADSGAECAMYWDLKDPSDPSVSAFSNSSGTVSNVAQGQSASQSSTYPSSNTIAADAVDGNTDGSYYDGSITHTNSDTNAWWEVDLGQSYNVSSINVWGRTDCCGDRLSDYWVFVSNTPFADSDTPATLSVRASTWSFHQTSQPNPNTVLAVPNFYGRYVRVQLSGTNYLSLAELQVMASSGSPPPPGSITCNNQTVTTGGQAVQTVPTQPSQIGGAPVSIFQINFANSCAIVQVTKNADGTTKIDSRGYNTCDTSVSRRFERGITITY